MVEESKACFTIIRIGAQLDPQSWEGWFDFLEVVNLPEGQSELRGELDQAALFSVLFKMYDLGLELLKVERK
jgi:hypothetical protein